MSLNENLTQEGLILSAEYPKSWVTYDGLHSTYQWHSIRKVGSSKVVVSFYGCFMWTSPLSFAAEYKLHQESRIPSFWPQFGSSKVPKHPQRNVLLLFKQTSNWKPKSILNPCRTSARALQAAQLSDGIAVNALRNHTTSARRSKKNPDESTSELHRCHFPLLFIQTRIWLRLFQECPQHVQQMTQTAHYLALTWRSIGCPGVGMSVLKSKRIWKNSQITVFCQHSMDWC